MPQQNSRSLHQLKKKASEYGKAQRLFDAAQFDEAASICFRVLGEDSESPKILQLLGSIFLKREQFETAQFFFEEAIAIRPDEPEFWSKKGFLYLQIGQYQDAKTSYEHRVELLLRQKRKGKALARAYCDLGVACFSLGELRNAISFYDQADAYCTEDQRDTLKLSWNRSIALLGLGEYENAWQGYEDRIHQMLHTKRPGPVWAGSKPWQGESLEGKTLLIYCEQGLGDAIQYARFLPMVKLLGATIICECSLVLLSLFEDFSDYVDQFVPRKAQGLPMIKCDYYTYSMSLTCRLGVTLENLPNETPYFYAKKEKIQKWQKRLKALCSSPGPKVGLVWAGSDHSNFALRNRPIQIEEFIPFIQDIRDLNLIGLQKDHGLKQLDNLSPDHTIQNLGDGFRDFSDTAAVIDQLDLVVTIDTAVAHLSGAMNKPTWLILSHPPDWRWGVDTETSIWYPSIKIYRKVKGQGWASVFYNVSLCLRNYCTEFKSLQEQEMKSTMQTKSGETL